MNICKGVINVKQPKIWCDVTCTYCGAVAKSSGYYSPERIKALKQEVKNWKVNDGEEAVCPNCSEELED